MESHDGLGAGFGGAVHHLQQTLHPARTTSKQFLYPRERQEPPVDHRVEDSDELLPVEAPGGG
ncbi:hypothetical protein [Tsukamurella soli]|uniref:hypothetical protein n=1 Tax=Tsukamurella soli TaxID=644556 RepID=UPI0031F19EA8